MDSACLPEQGGRRAGSRPIFSLPFNPMPHRITNCWNQRKNGGFFLCFPNNPIEKERNMGAQELVAMALKLDPAERFDLG
jgi:hypothetical protein